MRKINFFYLAYIHKVIVEHFNQLVRSVILLVVVSALPSVCIYYKCKQIESYSMYCTGKGNT